MKILFLTNNEITNSLYDWLSGKKDVIGLKLKHPLTIDILKALSPDFVISYNYKHIIKEDVLKVLDNKIINLHISYLPYNKGAHPILWSVVEGTLSGVTIHIIDKGIDTGKILVQKIVELDKENDTLQSAYQKLHKEIQQLFIENWDKIKNGGIKPYKQIGQGTYHNVVNFSRFVKKYKKFNWNMKIKDI